MEFRFLKKFKIIDLIKELFCIKEAPIGLTSIGLKMDYLGTVNNFNRENISFYLDILYPVQKPYFFQIN